MNYDVMKRYLLLTMFIVSVQLPAQNLELKELRDSVRTLSIELSTLKENLKTREEQFNLKADQILYEKSQKIDEKVAETKNTQWWIMGGLALLGLGGIGGFLKLLSENKKRVETAMQERMDGLIKNKQSYFQDLIRNQEIESRILAEDNFFVLSANGAAEKEIQGILNSLGFPQGNVQYHQLGPDRQVPKEVLPDDQVIIINNTQGSFGVEAVQQVFKKANSNAMLLGYTTGQDNRLPYDPRLNNANSKFTLYNNLILLAKFRRLTTKNTPA